MTWARSYEWFLHFYLTESGLDCFSWHVLPKLSNRVNFDFPKVSKMNINFELLKVSKMASLKIYISPVTEKLEASNLDSRLTSLKWFHWVLCLRW